MAAGAFGAHGAEGDNAEWLKTGAQYQLAHALAALLALQLEARGPAWLFIIGGFLFAAHAVSDGDRSTALVWRNHA